MKLNRDKTPEDVLKEEFLQERAAVLGRAGEKVSAALEKLHGVEKIIEEHLIRFKQIEEACRAAPDRSDLNNVRRQTLKDVNREIGRFNRAREYAKTRYYYLIVTREAMGFNKHHWVEDMYKIPPLKNHLQDE